MSMGSRSLKPATSEDLALQAACRAAGCEACHQLGLPIDEHCGAREFNHIKVGGHRIGERIGYSLGRWHHQGFVLRGMTFDEMLEKYGPNYRDDKRSFHARFGSEQTLLNGQRDRIGVAREQIPSKRDLRELAGEGQVSRKSSSAGRPIKSVPRRLP